MDKEEGKQCPVCYKVFNCEDAINLKVFTHGEIQAVTPYCSWKEFVTKRYMDCFKALIKQKREERPDIEYRAIDLYFSWKNEPIDYIENVYI